MSSIFHNYSTFFHTRNIFTVAIFLTYTLPSGASDARLTFSDFANSDPAYLAARESYMDSFKRPVALNKDGSLFAFYSSSNHTIYFNATGQGNADFIVTS